MAIGDTRILHFELAGVYNLQINEMAFSTGDSTGTWEFTQFHSGQPWFRGVSFSITVSHCVSLCLIVSRCVSLCLIVSRCVSLCLIVSYCVSLCLTVSYRLAMAYRICLFMPFSCFCID